MYGVVPSSHTRGQQAICWVEHPSCPNLIGHKFNDMSLILSNKGSSGGPGSHNATGTKASKIDRVIGYFLRKRKGVVNAPKVSVECATTVLDSKYGYRKLQDECDNMTFSDTKKLDMSDRDILEGNTTIQGCGVTAPLNVLHDMGDLVSGNVVLKTTKPGRRTFKTESSQQCDECQTDGCFECQTDFKTYDKQLESIPRRLVAKLRAKKTTRFVYSQLLNFLRCKHFMHVRDTHFITTLVSDARAWLLKSGYTMETSLDYAILSTAVQQAFIISAEELEFRASMKNPRVLDHIKHHNATMEGNLGRVNMFEGETFKRAAKRIARRPFTRTLTLGAPRPENLV